jgi:Ca2+-binding EF-hand superfamily protein
MICGNKSSARYSTASLSKKYYKRFRFPESKLMVYIERFKRMGNEKGFSKEKFRENMGLLGLDSTCLIADRIFTVMNKSGNGTVTIREYLEYMDILQNGSPDEKSEQSFKLITNSEYNGITYENFVDWIINIWKMYNTLTGSEINSSEEDILYYFNKLDRKGDGVIDLQEYKESMLENQNLYEWFEFANKGIAENNFMKEIDKPTFKESLKIIDNELTSCLEILDLDRRVSSKFTNKSFGTSFLGIRQSDSGIIEDSDNDRPAYNNGDDDDVPEDPVIDEQYTFRNMIHAKIDAILVSVRAIIKEKDIEPTQDGLMDLVNTQFLMK